MFLGVDFELSRLVKYTIYSKLHIVSPPEKQVHTGVYSPYDEIFYLMKMGTWSSQKPCSGIQYYTDVEFVCSFVKYCTYLSNIVIFIWCDQCSPVQMLVSRPEMVYPTSQVQCVVPWTWLHLDGCTNGSRVVKGNEVAAAAPEVAAEMLVVVAKTGGRERDVGKHLSAAYSIHLNGACNSWKVEQRSSFLARKNVKLKPKMKTLARSVTWLYCKSQVL